MGKAQSKRSVDITTETTKKGPEGGDEVTGKLEKIEDIDAKQVNGDATPQEKNDAAGEKKDAPDETENEKDLTTEKTAAESTASPPSTDGRGDQSNADATESSPKEDAAAAETTPSKVAESGEEITPLADENLKKAKKDKPKKKWSFRSISFGKKDKQKPVKNEGSDNVAENAAAATNGETTETNKPAEDAAAEETKKDAVEAKSDDKPEEKIENGVATEKEQQQMNGQKTPPTTPTDDAESKKPIETSTNVAVNETATTVATNAIVTSIPASAPAATSQAAAAVAAAAASSTETAKDSHVEKIEAVISNGTADAEKNGDVHVPEVEMKIAAQTEDIKSAIPAVDEKPHQNGTNGDEAIDEITAATKTLQIEVKTEHEFDSVKSTTTTTTTTTTTSNSTTTTIIPDDNLNSEQKTTIDNPFITTSAKTDTNTNTNTSITSTKNSIATVDEDESSKKALETVAESMQAIVETTEIVTEMVTGDTDAIPPPPLPLSAPPSQFVIFALKDNDNADPAISAIETEESKRENFEENINESFTKSSTESSIDIPVKTIEVEGSIDEPTKVEIEEFAEPTTKSIITEEIEIVEIITPVNVEEEEEEEKDIKKEEEQEHMQIQQPIGVIDDFAAEALIIVDQIQKDLEKEDDDSQQQTDAESERSLNGNDFVETTERLCNVELEFESHEDVAKDPIISSIPITNTEQSIEEAVSSVEENMNESSIEIPMKTIDVPTLNVEIEEFTEPTKSIITEEIEIVEIITPTNVAIHDNDNDKYDDGEEEEENKKEKQEDIQIQPPIDTFDDFTAQAFIIVDQIQKDLEIEDDDSQQQTEEDSERSQSQENIAEALSNTEQSIEIVVGNVEANIEDLKETVAIISTISNSETIETPENILDFASDPSKLTFSNEEKNSQHEIGNGIENGLKSQVNEEEVQNGNQENDVERNEGNENVLIKKISPPQIEIKSESQSESELIKEESEFEIFEPQSHPTTDIVAEDKTTTRMIIIDDEDDDDKDDEFIVSSSNKEIPSAKDLKENAAAAEITTQDLPVTCE